MIVTSELLRARVELPRFGNHTFDRLSLQRRSRCHQPRQRNSRCGLEGTPGALKQSAEAAVFHCCHVTPG
jgi:hypothetical protein